MALQFRISDDLCPLDRVALHCICCLPASLFLSAVLWPDASGAQSLLPRGGDGQVILSLVGFEPGDHIITPMYGTKLEEL